jgi:glycosyltransferase involved in cell wall biosynthesis
MRSPELDGTRIERTEGNLGYGAGCNVGVRAASGDDLLFLNADVVLTAGASEASTGTDLPVLRETGGPSSTYVTGDRGEDWAAALSAVLTDDARHSAARAGGL